MLFDFLSFDLGLYLLGFNCAFRFLPAFGGCLAKDLLDTLLFLAMGVDTSLGANPPNWLQVRLRIKQVRSDGGLFGFD
jgi:hypothetical protein